MTSGTLIVVGMAREARAARPLGRVVVGVEALAQALGEGASGVLSFGLCGGLDPALAPGDLLLGTTVGTFAVDVDWLARLTRALPGAVLGGVVGSDAIVGSVSAKAALRAATGGIAADMESHRAAELAFEAGVPFAILRAVSDGASESLPLCAQSGFRPDGSVDIGAVVRGLIAHPSEFPALMRTARNAGKAMAALAEAAIAVSHTR
jgi:hopanoid-associated phosphorylase